MAEGKAHKAIRQALGKAEFAEHESKKGKSILLCEKHYYGCEAEGKYYPLHYAGRKTAQKRIDKLEKAGILCRLTGYNHSYIEFLGYTPETEEALEREKQAADLAEKIWNEKQKRHKYNNKKKGEKTMPNWCNTEYILRGKKEDLEACARIINKFAFGDYPQEDKKYGTYQLIDREIGGSLDSQDVRNDFEQAEIETGSDGREYLQTWTSTAWKPAHELIEKLCKKFNLTYLYFSEEPGSGIYQTNDKNGDFFSSKFVIEQESASYYETVNEALEDIKNKTGIQCKTLEEAETAINDFNNKHEDNTITLIKIEII